MDYNDDMRTSDIRALYTWLDERMNQLANNQREQHSRLRDDMQNGFRGVNDRLDHLNGKTNDNARNIAVLQDRSDRAERQTTVIGAVTGGGTAGIIMLIKAWLTKP